MSINRTKKHEREVSWAFNLLAGLENELVITIAQGATEFEREIDWSEEVFLNVLDLEKPKEYKIDNKNIILDLWSSLDSFSIKEWSKRYVYETAAISSMKIEWAEQLSSAMAT